MDRFLYFPHRYCEHLAGYERYHAYPCPEPWSRRRVVVTWIVAALFVIAGAGAAVAVRNGTERSWCSGGVGAPAGQQCLDEQKAIRCGPFWLFHCPPGGD